MSRESERMREVQLKESFGKQQYALSITRQPTGPGPDRRRGGQACNQRFQDFFRNL